MNTSGSELPFELVGLRCQSIFDQLFNSIFIYCNLHALAMMSYSLICIQDNYPISNILLCLLNYGLIINWINSKPPPTKLFNLSIPNIMQALLCGEMVYGIIIIIFNFTSNFQPLSLRLRLNNKLYWHHYLQ